MARGLDLGSTHTVLATRQPAGPVFRTEATAYFAMVAGRRTQAILRNAGIHPVDWEGRILVLGEDASKIALVHGSPDDLRQPLQTGVFRPGDTEAEAVVGLLLEAMLDQPQADGEPVAITIPGHANDHHRHVVTQLCERAGFRPALVPQGLAVLLAEAELPSISGLALNFGACGIHVALVWRGELLSSFTCPHGGRAIDAKVARETGFPVTKVSWRKEKKFSFLEGTAPDTVLAAVRQHADRALAALCDDLHVHLAESAERVTSPVELIAAGGMAVAPGFAAWLREGLGRHGTPVGIKKVRVAAEPSTCTATGALIAAVALEGASRNSRDALERRAASWNTSQQRAVEPSKPTRGRSGPLIDPREDSRAEQVLIEPNRLKRIDDTVEPPSAPRQPTPAAPRPRPDVAPSIAEPEPTALAEPEPEPELVYDASADASEFFDGLAEVEVASIDGAPDDVEPEPAGVTVEPADISVEPAGVAVEPSGVTVEPAPPEPIGNTGGDVEPLDVKRLLGKQGGHDRPVPPVKPASKAPTPAAPHPAAAKPEADGMGNLTEMLKALWGRVRKLEATAEELEAEKKAELARAQLERGDARTVTVPEKYKRFFQKMVHDGASDLFVSAGARAAVRIDGRVKFVTGDQAGAEFARQMFESLLGVSTVMAFSQRKGLDFAFAIPNVGRFRANLFHQKGELGGVFRHIKDKVPTFEELNLPAKQLMRLAKLQRGLVLVTGIAGSGKSTTLGAMMEFINETMHRHVITIEDPIEFVYREKLSVIDQREVGLDTVSFARALKSAVRQSPDVILVGEMRDKDTMEAAIQAAETGHLVFSTLHTVNAQQTVERIITYFPPHQHELLRLQLSMVLAGVVSQRLLPKRDEGGRVPAVEVMLTTPTIKDLLYEGRTRELYAAIQEDTYFGNQTFNESLRRLYEAGVISLEEAMAAADNPDELKLEIRGISRGTKAGDMDLQF